MDPPLMLVQPRFIALLLQSGSAPLPEHPVANIFQPLASPARAEYNLALFVIAITAVIFLVVGGLLVYTMVRFRRKRTDDTSEPPQVYGSSQIEIAWTVIPILIVFILIGVTARVVAGVEDHGQSAGAVHATVIGHQWWWEIHYPDLEVTTANELHVPAAGPNAQGATFLSLQSADVIHSFWVPQLAGKTDLIPNRTNSMWIDPREPGVYLGNCAEYCGTQHANMLLRVVVQTPADFSAWASAQKVLVPAEPATNEAVVYNSLACVNCHTIQGTASHGKFGPDLTHLMSRQTIGAGVLPNSVQNLKAWIDDPQIAKEGCLMPSMKLTGAQLDQVVTYLSTLR